MPAGTTWASCYCAASSVVKHSTVARKASASPWPAHGEAGDHQIPIQKKYGRVPRPSFPVVRRDGKPVKTVASVTDDFRTDDDSGPPEREPNDPGYDLLYPPR